MLVALVGTRSSGKTAVENYLVAKHGFVVISLRSNASALQVSASFSFEDL
jgi:dephospho-CoA kinase